MFCRKCGNEIPDGVKFCTYCGTPVQAKKTVESKSAESKPAGMQMPGSGIQPQKAKKSVLPVIGIAACVVIALGMVGAAFFFSSYGKGENSADVQAERHETDQNENQAENLDVTENTQKNATEDGTQDHDLADTQTQDEKNVPNGSALAQKITTLNKEENAIPSIDIDADNYKPAERDVNAAWDPTLFYTLEDVDKESTADGLINTFLITKKELMNTDTGNLIEYDIYTNPATNFVHKIVSIEYMQTVLGITEYYFTDDGKVNFIYTYSDTNYFPSYATPNRDGNRYYFSNDILTKWRVVSNGIQTNYVLGENAAAVSTNAGDIIMMKDFTDAQQKAFDQKEKEMINAAYNTYNAILSLDGIAVIQGYVYDENSNLTDGVNVSLYETGSDECLYTAKTDSDGLYAIYVPAEDRNYEMTFKKENCTDVKMYDVALDSQTLGEYQSAVYLIPAGEDSDVAVKVDDALNYDADCSGMVVVADAQYAVRDGINNRNGEVVASGTTDGSGNINIKLPVGMYTVQIAKDGYDQSYFSLTVRQNNDMVQYHLSPKLASGEMRIVLTWDSSPRDLDSHLFTPYCTAADHISFYHTADEKGNSLDVDVTSGYGPETVTVTNLETNGLYKYYVADYTNCSDGNYASYEMSYSNACVHVYSQNGLVAEFHVPAGRPGVIWEVFEIRNGTIIPSQRYYQAVEDNDWWSVKY